MSPSVRAWSYRQSPVVSSNRETALAPAAITLSLACLAWVCARPEDWPAKVALILSCWIFAATRLRGYLLLPTAVIAIFAPLRLIGTFLANDALKGMDTVQYSVTAESVRLAAVTAVILSISASMLSPDPAASARLFSRLRPLGANYRQVCWTGLIVSTCLFVILAGSVPLLSDGAESERVAAQAGRAYLVFVAYVAGVVLAIDIAVRLRRGFYSTATAYVRIGIVATLLLASASRLPALVALTAFFAASVSLRRSEGLPVVKQIIVAPALGVVFAATVGAARASYVGFTGGWSSVLEHFLRRVAADAGNLALLSSRDLGTLISPTEFVSAPFVTYLPGSQRNLGQLLKDRLDRKSVV